MVTASTGLYNCSRMANNKQRKQSKPPPAPVPAPDLGGGRRPGRPRGRTWRPLMLSMLPERLAIAEEIGDGHAATGVYRLLDFARHNPAVVALARELAEKIAKLRAAAP